MIIREHIVVFLAPEDSEYTEALVTILRFDHQLMRRNHKRFLNSKTYAKGNMKGKRAGMRMREDVHFHRYRDIYMFQ